MKILKDNDIGILKAVEILSAEGVVAFPTETVYGLGALSSSDKAVSKVFEIKGRPKFNPLIIHVANIEMALDIGKFSETALKLANKFWPGPLTIVLKKKNSKSISKLATAGLNTVAIRIPNNTIAQRIITKIGVPIAAPSANVSGKLSCTKAEDIKEKLSERIDGIILGGQCELGLESTVIECSENCVSLMRLGSIPIEKIKEFLKLNKIKHSYAKGIIKSPGQLLHHYSPDSNLILNQKNPDHTDLYLSFGIHPDGVKGLNLSETENLGEAAKNLFSHLHELDRISKKLGGKTIKVAPIPEMGLGLSINDRLRRAAKKK